MLKKAMILAAGMGTRLGDMTIDKPKALIAFNGKPMLEFTIERLKQQGIENILVNIHHHADQVLSFLDSKDFGLEITISDERNLLLDTGGAILHAADFFRGTDPILIHNVDIISGLDLESLAACHHKKNALATLCVRKRKSGRALLFDEHMKLAGWTNHETGKFKWTAKEIGFYQAYAFNGVYLISPDFANRIPFTGRFSIIDAWLKMAAKEKIYGYEDKSDTWFDLGTKEKIAAAEKALNDETKND